VWDACVAYIVVAECLEEDEEDGVEVVVPQSEHALPRQLDEGQHRRLTLLVPAITPRMGLWWYNIGNNW